MKPSTNQQALIDLVAKTVNLVLSYWPTRSGKTTVRHMIAARIISDDDSEPRKVMPNPYL